jgi:predicted nucleotidyltransferase
MHFLMRPNRSSGAVCGRGVARSGERVVRLSDVEREGVLWAVERASREVGVAWRRILVFGSRADLQRKGGDIDLLVDLGVEPAADVYKLKQRLVLALEDELGEQKVDVVIDNGTQREAFFGLARTQGVELWIND